MSDAIREFGPQALDRILFKPCNESIKQIVSIVADSMQEGLTDHDNDAQILG